jgi:hypothetical protein
MARPAPSIGLPRGGTLSPMNLRRRVGLEDRPGTAQVAGAAGHRDHRHLNAARAGIARQVADRHVVADEHIALRVAAAGRRLCRDTLFRLHGHDDLHCQSSELNLNVG